MKNERNFKIERRAKDDGTFEVSISSEYPYKRWDGEETLVHTPDAIDLSRFPIPLLDSHDTSRLNIGVIENPTIEGKKLRGVLRFGRRQEAQAIREDVESGIISNMSVGYSVNKKRQIDDDSYQVTNWMPYEASLVSVPADPTVGIGRSFKTNHSEGQNNMSKNKFRTYEAWGSINEHLENGGTQDDKYFKLCREYDKRAEDVNWPTFSNVGLEGVRTYFKDNPDPLAIDPETERRLRAAFDRKYGSDSSEPSTEKLYRFNEPLPTGQVDPEQRKLDLGKYLRGVVTGNWEGAESEHRAMGLGTDTLGGYLLPNPMSSKIIDLARNQSVVMQAGALTMPMESSSLKLCKVTKDPTGYWRAEHQAITESEANFGTVSMNARVVAGLVRLSIEQLEDTANVGQIVESTLAAALALKLDYAALFGTGASNEPLGLFNAGIEELSMGTNGAALSSSGAGYRKFSNAVTTLKLNNANPQTVVFSPRTEGALDLLMDGVGLPLIPPESYKKLTKFSTNQVPIDQSHGSANNASCAFVGGFENLVIGMRKGITIEATRVGGTDTFKKMQVLIRAYMRADTAVTRDNHFCKITGIIPSE